MAQPVYYQTMNNVGIDPTLYYTNLFTQGASVTPEFPAPPFLPGTRAFGSDGSEFLFVQASTTINPGDFLAINAGVTTFPFSAASLTSTNAAAVGTIQIGSAGLVLKQSVSNIPANAYFWACTRGNFVPAYASNGTNGMAAAANVVLYTSATAGVLTSLTATTAVAVAGIVCINSVTVSIPSSLVPPVGTLTSTGFATGPIVAMQNVRPIMYPIGNTTAAQLTLVVGY